MKNGIDVSVFQADIKWEKVRSAGIEIAMIKATQGRSEANPNTRMFTDRYFMQNIIRATGNGITCGVYHYLTAQTIAEAKEEAEYFCSVISPYKSRIALWSAVDVESTYLPNDPFLLTSIVKAFCETVSANGFTPCFYTNPDFMEHRLCKENLRDIPLWLAKWGDPTVIPRAYVNMVMWQWGAKTVDGVNGGCDADIMISETCNKIESDPLAKYGFTADELKYLEYYRDAGTLLNKLKTH